LWSNASIIEFSKWVLRHQVTNEFALPVHPLLFRKGAATSVRPECMSTTVPYWSNMQILTDALRLSTSLMDRSVPHPQRDRAAVAD
jgi:hypothetical protein